MAPANFDRRTDPERLASVETEVRGLKDWVQSLDVKVDTLTASFHIGSTKLDQILEKLKESAEDRRQQREELRRQGELLHSYGDSLKEHMAREERQLDELSSEIVEAETRQSQRLRDANEASVSDRKDLWGAIKKFHGDDAQPKKEAHWADKIIDSFKRQMIDKISLIMVIVALGWMISALDDAKTATKAVQTQLEKVVPK